MGRWPRELLPKKAFCLLSIFRPFFFCRASEKEREAELYFLLWGETARERMNWTFSLSGSS